MRGPATGAPTVSDRGDGHGPAGAESGSGADERVDYAEIERLDSGAIERLRLLNRPGDPDIVGLLLEAFEGDSRRQLQAIAEGVRAGDGDLVRRTAHSLKSSSANLGAMRLSALCRDLEESGRIEHLEEARALAALAEEEREAVWALLAKL